MTSQIALKALRRSWWVVVVFALFGAVTGFGVAKATTPVYQASTSVYVGTTASNVTDLTTGSSFAAEAVKTYANLVTTSSILDPAIREAGMETTASALAADIDASVPLNTSMLDITVKGTDRAQTIAVTQAITDRLIASVSSLSPRTTTKSAKTKKVVTVVPVTMSQVQKVTASVDPISPRTGLDIGAGLALGLILGIGLGALREVVDNRLRSQEDLRLVTDLPVLGEIARDKKASRRPLIAALEPLNPRSEAFRALRTNLQYLDMSRGHAVVVTSATPSEGKTTTMANLAITLAQGGDRVCLIDADLRQPKVASTFGLDGGVGLTDVLIGKASLRTTIQWWGEHRIGVLPAGRIPPNPSEMLASDRMVRLLEGLEKSFDVILIDAPPILPVTDAAVLSTVVSGVIMVGAVNQVSRNQFRSALERLNRVGANVFGVVLTKVPARGASNYGYYGARYGTSQPAEAPTVTADMGAFEDLLDRAPARSQS